MPSQGTVILSLRVVLVGVVVDNGVFVEEEKGAHNSLAVLDHALDGLVSFSSSFGVALLGVVDVGRFSFAFWRRALFLGKGKFCCRYLLSFPGVSEDDGSCPCIHNHFPDWSRFPSIAC